MAIKKAIKQGDVLWKMEVPHQYSNGVRITKYCTYQLDSRRARTRGVRIPPDMAPIFEALNIKLIPNRQYYNRYSNEQFGHIDSYTAVGVSSYNRPESVYRHLEIAPAAWRCYRKLKNNVFSSFLPLEQLQLDDDLHTPDSFIHPPLEEGHFMEEFDPFS